MEPFDVYCETCHARLRVREERFVGEIHPCPKCSSMVFIIAPMVPTDSAADGADLAGAGQGAAGVGMAAKLAGLVGRHAVVWSACGAVLVVAGGLTMSLLGDGDEQVVARVDQAASTTNAPVASIAESIDGTSLAEKESIENEPPLPIAAAADDETWDDGAPATRTELNPVESVAALPPLSDLPEADDATGDEPTDAAAAEAKSATSTPAPLPEQDPSDNAQPKRTRKLRLDPLAFDPKRASLGNVTGRTSTDAPREYSSEIDDDAADASAKPQAAKIVDVAAQLSVRLESIDVPATTLADFLRMFSDMAAVPIRLDPAAGVSPQTKVSVRGQDVALGKLLDDVLAQHGLVRKERNGTLILVRHEPD